MIVDPEKRIVTIDYTNWRGERRERDIYPMKVWFGSTKQHPQEQWLLKAMAMDKEEVREFAMSGIHSWRPRW